MTHAPATRVDLETTSEIAARLGVTIATVTNWAARYPHDFIPWADFSGTPVYLRADVDAFCVRYNLPGKRPARPTGIPITTTLGTVRISIPRTAPKEEARRLLDTVKGALMASGFVPPESPG